MSYPYPQDRHRDRKEEGQEPYAGDREAFAQQEAALQAQAEAFGEARRDRENEETDAERAERLATELRRVNDEVMAEQRRGADEETA